MSAQAHKMIVLTGASGGIGVELARQYARPGRRLALIARDRVKLEALATSLKDTGCDLETAALDVRDRDVLHDYLVKLDARHPVDLVIANAGVTAGLGPDRSREADEDADRQLDINYRGAVNTVTGVVEAMRLRGRGQIVLVASLAGMKALPDMPSYSASKAALIAYGHALRGWLNPFGVDVTIICPGFVTSPMSARHKGAKPFEMSAEKAARMMLRAIEKRRAFYAFPFLLATGIRLQNLLPARISDWFMGGFKAEIEEDPRFKK
ncbi:SDR family NAD(P)-dependent oxidoreductase [Roseibium algae]|uniref:SDR family NAD(P)-dependent oxidoreductase n=1 Tax=Roseibium algae TaxID=3123038 RepID=A0ABU8TQY0_9HYPH